MKIPLFLLVLVSLCPSATLRESADKIGLNIGTSLEMDLVAADSVKYNEVAAREFNMAVPGLALKMKPLQPVEGEFHFELGDTLVDFGQRNSMKLRGHTLVWYNNSPDWAQTPLPSRERLLQIMKTHIDTVLTHYKGKMAEWDVVNEPIWTASPGDLRESFWRNAIGPDYIDSAFAFAHRADPDAKLILNDYNTEAINAKSDALYALVSKLKGKGIPIQGVGFQTHITTREAANFFTEFDQNMKRFAKLGVDIAITELDISLFTPIDPADYQKQANMYAECLRVCLRNPGCKTFTMWGFTDAHSWIPGRNQGKDDALIFDRSYEPKPAYHALAAVLDSVAALSPIRRRGGGGAPEVAYGPDGIHVDPRLFSSVEFFGLEGDRVSAPDLRQGSIRFAQLKLRPGLYLIKCSGRGPSYFGKILIP